MKVRYEVGGNVNTLESRALKWRVGVEKAGVAMRSHGMLHGNDYHCRYGLGLGDRRLGGGYVRGNQEHEVG